MTDKKIPTRKNTQAQNKTVEVVKEDGTIETKKLGKRTPLYAQKRVGIKDRPGYTRRLVNQKLGRVESFLEAGWTPVNQEDQDTITRTVQDTKDLGSLYRPLVNPSGNLPYTHAVWMEIPTELYEEDQQAKLRQSQDKEAQVDPQQLQNNNPDLYYLSKYKKTLE